MVESVKNHPKNKDNIINLNPGLLNPLVSRCLDQQTPPEKAFHNTYSQGIWGMLED